MTHDRFGLQLQTLPSAKSRVLLICDLLRRRATNERFRVREVSDAFAVFHVPSPANISATLTQLSRDGLAIAFGGGEWGLTPIGAETAEKMGITTIEAHSPNRIASAEFAHVDHTVIPHWAAPPRWKPGIARLLERHPFDRNILCMTRFPSEGGIPDPVASAVEVAKVQLASAGLKLHLASDSIVDDDLMGNVGAYMWACRYGLAILEDRIEKGLNYNAVIELGGMTLLGRRCAILKDRTAPNSLPSDLSGSIYKSVDLDDREEVSAAVSGWAHDDLRIPVSA